MKRENLNIKSVEEILNSLDGMSKAQTSLFFYSKLLNRIQIEQGQKQMGNLFFFKPVCLVTTLILLISMNAFLLVKQKKQFNSQTMVPSIEASNIQSFSAEYELQSNLDF